MNKVPATVVALAVPFEAVYFTHWPLALYDQAGAVRFGPLWRMAHVRGHQEDVAFLEVDAFVGTVYPQAQISVAAHLVEKFFERVVVIVAAPVRPPNHGNDKIAVLPDLLIAHGRLEQMSVLVDPAREIERLAISEHRTEEHKSELQSLMRI